MNIITFITFGITIVVAMIGVFSFGWLNILKETNNLLRAQVEELKVANKELLEKHNDSIKQLSSMQGQLDVLKSIPLVNIDVTLQEISKFNKSLADTNEKILDRLNSDAMVLAQETKNVGEAVKDVKIDLAKNS
jgi:hypothetical protein